MLQDNHLASAILPGLFGLRNWKIMGRTAPVLIRKSLPARVAKNVSQWLILTRDELRVGSTISVWMRLQQGVSRLQLKFG